MAPLMIQWALRNRWALFAVVTCSTLSIGLVLQTYLQFHYLAPITCFNSVFMVQAMRLWRWRNRKVGRVVLWLVPLLGLASLAWSLNGPMKQDDSSIWLKEKARVLHQLPKQNDKHLIVVSYGAQHSFDNEWVYNEADIDSARVVFARRMDRIQDCELVNLFRFRRIWSLHIENDKSPPKLTPYPIHLCR